MAPLNIESESLAWIGNRTSLGSAISEICAPSLVFALIQTGPKNPAEKRQKPRGGSSAFVLTVVAVQFRRKN